MRRAHVDPLFQFGMYPAARNPTTGKDEGVVAVFVDDGELKIALVRRRGYRLPHEGFIRLWSSQQFDLDQGI